MDLTKIDLSLIPAEYKAELLALLEKREVYRKYNKLEYFNPYEFQKQFYGASGKFQRRFLCAANR